MPTCVLDCLPLWQHLPLVLLLAVRARGGVVRLLHWLRLLLVCVPLPLQSNVTAFQIDPAFAVVSACSQLNTPSATCLDGSIVDGIANACAAGKYGIQINDDLKVCALCPAGERAFLNGPRQ